MPNLPDRHAALLALLDGLAAVEQEQGQLPILSRCWDADEQAWFTLADNALPLFLADMRERAEAAFAEWVLYEGLCGTARRMAKSRKLNEQSRADAAETLDHAAQWREYHAAAHTRICRVVLAAARGAVDTSKLEEVVGNE